MSILLLFLIANVFAAKTIACPETTASSSAGKEFLQKFMSKILAGLALTIQHHLTQGNEYAPIEQEVTYWCIKPNQNILIQTHFNDTDIKSKLDFSKPINFLIHGWLSGLLDRNMHLGAQSKVEPNDHDGWMRMTAIDWVHHADSNVCVVDWSRLANYDYPMAATEHTKMVTESFVRFMNFLVQSGMDIEKVSIAAHSLGAQIAGLIGHKFGGKLEAIYGIDPAGPGFTIPKDYGIDSRLDPTDAKYVQCIYTTQYTLGTAIDCGHGNFYMNGGLTQPGCGANVLCSHSRAQEYFTESIQPDSKFVGEHCDNYAKRLLTYWLNTPCSGKTDLMGIYSQRKSGKFYASTNSNPPFAPTKTK